MIGFKKCFVCEKEMTGTHWYHNECAPEDGWREEKPEVVQQLSNPPECIPKHQHYRYIRRIYLGKT
jgi:hypothetical protein